MHQNYVFSTSFFHIKFSHRLLRSSSTSCTNLNSRHFQSHACSTLRGARVPWRRWPEKKDGSLPYRPPAAQIVVLGHRFFFFCDFYQFWEGNVYHVYVELIELICLPSMFTVNCVLASLEDVQQRRESQQSCRRVERSVRDSQENFQIKAGRVLALGASHKQLSHCGKKQSELFFYFPPSFLIPPLHQETTL